MMTMDSTRHVMAGELKVGSGSDVLTCLLGSCVGIGMIWKRGGRCGLAHCFLPNNERGAGDAAARYVSLAVPALLSAMGVRMDQYDEVDVIVAGGARMLALASPGAVGPRNVAAAEEHLSRRGLAIRYADTGGRSGRRMSIDCDRQSYSVIKVGTDDGHLAAPAAFASAATIKPQVNHAYA